MPQALVTVTPDGGEPITVMVDDAGRYNATGLKPGTYTISAEAPGFSLRNQTNILVAAGKSQRIDFYLQIEVQQQEVEVTEPIVDSSPEKNGGAITISGKELDALADDPTALQQELESIAGADPETGAQFYVDGFSGGKLPPKSSIREIRINSNPYSAQYDQIGFGRIEIFTKPGTDKLHGSVWTQGNDSPWNALNPFTKAQPPYYSYFYEGDINGPINKSSSYFGGVFGQRSQSNLIVNAIILDSALNQTPFTQAVSSPSSFIDFGPRVDYQLGKTQTISLRYHLQRNTQQNSGVGQFALLSQAFNLDNTEQALQFSDTQAYGAKLVNETRFQYLRDRNNQISADNSTTISVQGAFTGGGNSIGDTRDKQDHYEFQDYLQFEQGKHDMNFGARVRYLRDSNYATTNFNGQYTFTSIDTYRITEQGIADGLTQAEIRAMGGGPSQFLQTKGTPGIAVSVFDAGLFAEDNWKLKPNVTFSYGLRFETQTQIHDRADFGPRTALSWSIPGSKNKPPRVVLRAGAGYFYQRFDSLNVLQADRQNGINQSEVIINSPCFPYNSPEAGCATASSSSPTIYQINPKLRTPEILQYGFGADLPISKIGNISANYQHTRDQHLYLTRNINAPLPCPELGPDSTCGVRPLGTTQNIYEYDSQGASNRNRFTINANLHAKQYGLFTYYSISGAEANTSGVSSFPSNSYNLHQDYGRATFVRQRAFIGGFADLPYHFNFNPFIIYQSSTPFNITTGTDNNGDSIFNDRPAFATDLSRPSVYKTKLGNFDADPIAGQTLIPINYGNGPGLIVVNLRLSRVFSFGPIIPDDNPPPPAPAKDAKTDSKPADTKPGDKAAAKTPAKPVKKPIERKYLLGIGINSNNIFNHVNLAPPVGILTSPLFGTSTALNNPFGPQSADRTVNLDLFFRF